MIYVALTEATVLLAVVAAFASLTRSLVRQHARREDLLINQILHLTGKTWTPPPAEPPVAPVLEPMAEYEFDPHQNSPY